MAANEEFAADNQVSKETDVKPVHPPFTTWTNLIIIFWAFFSFSMAVSLSAIATYVYIPQGMSLIWVSQVNIMTFCLNVPLTLYFASLSDNLTGKWARWGRRKPFICFSIPFACIGALMFAYPAQSKSNPHVFEYSYLLASLIIIVAPAAFFIPIKAWMIESCSSPAEYTTINGIIMLSMLFGGLLCQLILSAQYPSDPFLGAKLCSLFVLVSLPLSYLTLVWIVPSRELQKAPEQPPIVPSFRQCIRTKEFRTIFWNEVLTQMASSGAGVLVFPILYLFFGLVHTDSIQKYYAPTLVAVLIGSVFSILVLMCALKRFEKIVVFKGVMLCMVVLGLSTVATMIPGVLAYGKPGYYTPEQQGLQIVAFLGIFAVATILNVCSNFCQGLLVRDLIVFDTFTNRLNRESMYQTAISVPAMLLSSIPANFVLGLLYSTGFANKVGPTSAHPYITETYSWDKGTLIQLSLWTGIFSCVIRFGAYMLMSNYGLTTVVAKQMEEINLRREDQKKLLTAKEKEQEGAGDEENIEAGRKKSSSTATASTMESMGVDAAPDAAAESSLMNHLSQLENKAIKDAADVNGKNEALTKIRRSILLGGGLLGPAAMASLLTGLVFQIQNNLPFVTLLLTMFEIVAMYVGYEAFRYLAVSKLFSMSSDEAKAHSVRQVTRNDKYTLNLKEALEKAEIDEKQNDKSIPDDDSFVARLTMSRKSDMQSLLVQPELEDEKHPLSGYKRIFASCIVLFICGVLGAAQEAEKKI